MRTVSANQTDPSTVGNAHLSVKLILDSDTFQSIPPRLRLFLFLCLLHLSLSLSHFLPALLLFTQTPRAIFPLQQSSKSFHPTGPFHFSSWTLLQPSNSRRSHVGAGLERNYLQILFFTSAVKKIPTSRQAGKGNQENVMSSQSSQFMVTLLQRNK